MLDLVVVPYDATSHMLSNYAKFVQIFPPSLCSPTFIGTNTSATPTSKRRKTKRPEETPLHQLIEHILRAYASTRMDHYGRSLINSDISITNSNYEASKLKLQSLDDLIKAVSKFAAEYEIDHEATIDAIDADISLLRRCIISNTNERLWYSAMGPLLLPQDCSFYYGDLRRGLRILHQLYPQQYDIIVIDPPWQNKSVRRGSKYQTNFSNKDLLGLPVPGICNISAAVIAIWITNSDAVMSFVLDELFPAWELRHVSTWLWLKVDHTGAPIHSTSSMHKKCYERLLIGIRGHATTSVQASAQSNCLMTLTRNLPSLSDNEIVSPLPVVNMDVDNGGKKLDSDGFPCECIVSTPLRHSWKPPVHHRLRSALRAVVTAPPSGRYLELFARYIVPYSG